ncbi:MAG: hypothetical protein OHK93_004738 [Ramalina farinacea]|uniref:DUF6594 domain-containing protein n=1 Tax=Ramalina farinacea TaxID=258253 RepID=A0AA43QWF8_9LECA|nr:hypothetical protein [Ramalina farinacea]
MSSHPSASDPGEGSSTGTNVTQASTLSEEPPIEMVDLAVATRDPPTPATPQTQEAVAEATGHAVALLNLSAEAANNAGDNTQTPEGQSYPLSEEQDLEASRSSKDPSGVLGRLFAGLRTRRGKDVAQKPYIPPGFPKPIEDHPDGFPRLSAFVASASAVAMVRVFNFLRMRLIIERQVEIAKLQERLLQSDLEIAGENENELFTLDWEPQSEKRIAQISLMQEIHTKLKDYDDMVGRARTFLATKSPKWRNIQNYKTWLADEQPLNGRENDYLAHGYGYTALAERQDTAPLDGAIAKIMDKCVPKKSVFTPWEGQLKSNDDHIRYRSDTRVDICVKLVMTTSVVVLLVGPSAVLYLVPGVSQLETLDRNLHGPDSPLFQQSALKLLLITGCVGLFSLLLNVATQCRRYEVFVLRCSDKVFQGF